MRTNANFGVSGFRSQYLVLAKDARFQLRQYPMLRTTPRGFEPLRSKTTHLAGEPLNHSGKVSFSWCIFKRQTAPTIKKKQKKESSMSGNRTRGVCVTGRNVTNYTNTDLFLFQNLKHWIRSLMFEFQRVRCCNRDNVSSFDHTMVDTPHPIRTAQLSTIGPDQYCGGGPRGNLGCRMFFFFTVFFFFQLF